MQKRRFLSIFLIIIWIAFQGLYAMANEWVTLRNNSGQSITVKLLRIHGDFVYIQLQGGHMHENSAISVQ